MATRLICRLLGVPDVEVFRQWADALSPVFFIMTPEHIAAATQAITELQSYVDGLTTRRAKDPGSDLVTTLRAAEGRDHAVGAKHSDHSPDRRCAN